jgi:hypothetical protein
MRVADAQTGRPYSGSFLFDRNPSERKTNDSRMEKRFSDGKTIPEWETISEWKTISGWKNDSPYMITVGTPGLGVRQPDGESSGWIQFRMDPIPDRSNSR